MQVTIDQAMQLAVQYHQAGQLAQAEQICRQVLSHQPNHAEALHLLGTLGLQAGHLDEGIELIRRAIAINPAIPHYYNNLGNGLGSKGLLDEAVAAYRQALRLRPDYPEAHNNLGNVLFDKNQFDEAIACYRQAIRLKGDFAEAHNNLGVALSNEGLFDEAIAEYRAALRLKGDYADAHNNLGNALRKKELLDDAIAAYRQALRLRPNYAEAYSNLGNALYGKGQFDDAIASYRQSLKLKPNNSDAHNNLGNVLRRKGLFDDAISAYRQALRFKPDSAEACSNLGNALRDNGQIAESIAAHQQSIRLNPKYAEAYSSLGHALRDTGLPDEAIAAYRRAIQLKSDFAEPYHGLGIVQVDTGLHDEGIGSYRHAIQIDPNHVKAHSNLILALLYRSEEDPAATKAEHRVWAEQFARPLAGKIKDHGNDRSPQRRLRIGYVSADLRRHPVGYLLMPLFERHDRANFEIHCYFNYRRADDLTDRFKQFCNVWRDIADLSDEEVATRIRSDAIDVLVDLSAHTRGNRLLVFARKPAPIQVTYLAYPGTTGLDTIDYRITDPHFDGGGEAYHPPGEPEGHYTEQSFRLPRTYWCYQPPTADFDQTPLPAAGAGFVTFGCLNNFCKVTPAVLKTWSEVLSAVPDARLILHALDGSHRDRVRKIFAEGGIESGRLIFTGWAPFPEHLARYRQIDIALDPFPYVGGITTCDALWMGVPVVTLAGRTAIGRGGVSILSNVGLTNLIAQSRDEYVRVAKALADDKARLGDFRSTIRQQMKRSPLMDAKQFAADIENAYRQMWRRWCSRQPHMI